MADLFDILRAQSTGEDLTETRAARLDDRIPVEDWPWALLTDGAPHSIKLSLLGVARYATFRRYCQLVAGREDKLLEIAYRPDTLGDLVAVRFTAIDVPDFIKDMAVDPRAIAAPASASNGTRSNVKALPSRGEGATG